MAINGGNHCIHMYATSRMLSAYTGTRNHRTRNEQKGILDPGFLEE
jgi:hypothetical protein